MQFSVETYDGQSIKMPWKLKVKLLNLLLRMQAAWLEIRLRIVSNITREL